VFTVISAKAQIAIQPHLVMPTGYLGAVLKKAPGLSIGTVQDFDSRMRVRMLGDIVYFSPRMDPFDTYAIVSEGNTTTVYPGTEELNLYLNLSFSFGFDFSMVHKTNFNWYIGPDLIAGMTLRQYTSDIPYVSSGRDFSGVPFIGLRPRTGVEYSFEKMSLFLDLSRTYYLNTDAALLNYTDLGLGIRF
jgi:hypothetical protein